MLADPGTYCYHGEPGWRSYFRSTLAHNTMEVNGQDQSSSGALSFGLATRRTKLLELETAADGEVTGWSAEHDGYRSLNPPLRHRRSVRLASGPRRLEIVDCLETTGRHALRVAFHLGPESKSGRRSERRTRLVDGLSTRVATLILPGGSPGRSSEVRPTPSWVGNPRVRRETAGVGSHRRRNLRCTGTDSYTTVLQFHPETGRTSSP